jgi:ABC-type multidrug transport system fused ATPase/permease subunit
LLLFPDVSVTYVLMLCWAWLGPRIASIATGTLFAMARWNMTLNARQVEAVCVYSCIFVVPLAHAMRLCVSPQIFFRNILSQDAYFFDQSKSAELVSRLASEPEKMHNLLNHSLEKILRSLLGLIGGLWLMFRVDWRLSLAALLIRSPMTVKLTQLSSKVVHYYYRIQTQTLQGVRGTRACMCLHTVIL